MRWIGIAGSELSRALKGGIAFPMGHNSSREKEIPVKLLYEEYSSFRIQFDL